MKLIKVVCKEFKTGWSHNPVDVDSRMYHENGEPIIGSRGYHLGQISSSFGWAKQDIQNHFIDELDELFPEGYEFSFEFLTLNQV